MKKLVSVLLSAALLMGVAALPATAAEKTYALGDVNMDGRVDTKDAAITLCDYCLRLVSDPDPFAPLTNAHSELSEAQLMLADVNGSGCVDAVDAQLILNFYILHDLAGMDTLTMDAYIASVLSGEDDYAQLQDATASQYTLVLVDEAGKPMYYMIEK